MKLDIGDELVERIAQRAAELVQQNGESEVEDGWLRGADKIADYIDSPRSRVYGLSQPDAFPVHHDGSALIARRSDLDSWLRSGGGRRPWNRAAPADRRGTVNKTEVGPRAEDTGPAATGSAMRCQIAAGTVSAWPAQEDPARLPRGGTRPQRSGGKPMPAKLEKTRYPGIYKRGSRFVITWEYRGQQRKESFRHMTEASRGKGQPNSPGKSGPGQGSGLASTSRVDQTYAGRTSRGFSETTRPEYRRPIDAHALPRWKTWKLSEIEPADARDLFGQMRRDDCSTSQIKKRPRSAAVLFATAVEDGVLRSNPVLGVRIPAPSNGEAPEEEKAKALTRAELSVLLAALSDDWRLFFEFLTHTGLRISEAIGLRWEHLDLGENPKLEIREQLYKGKRKRLKSRDGERDLPLSPGMAQKLLAHRRDGYLGSKAPVFASKAGSPLDRKTSTAGSWLPPPSAQASKSRSKSTASSGPGPPFPSTRSGTPVRACSLRPAAT